MQRTRIHPILVLGMASLAAASVASWLSGPNLPIAFLRGFFDGLGLVCIYGYLLTLRPAKARRSRLL